MRNQRFEGGYTRSTEHQLKAVAGNVMDERSLFDADRVMDLVTVGYTAVVSPQLFLEARISARNETLKGVGAPTTDRVQGTLILDATNARRFWSPTFCGVCDP